MPRSVTLTLVSMAMLLVLAAGMSFKLAGGDLPLLLDLPFMLCLFCWPFVLLAAIVQRVREGRERRKAGFR